MEKPLANDVNWGYGANHTQSQLYSWLFLSCDGKFPFLFKATLIGFYDVFYNQRKPNRKDGILAHTKKFSLREFLFDNYDTYLKGILNSY